MTHKNENMTEKENVSLASKIGGESEREKARRVGLVCPNCGGELEGRKCKLVCVRRGCGYLVTCSEW